MVGSPTLLYKQLGGWLCNGVSGRSWRRQCVCDMVGQITGHLWHHFAGSWAHMSWLELALSLCLCHTLSLYALALHPSLTRHCCDRDLSPFAMVRAYARPLS